MRKVSPAKEKVIISAAETLLLDGVESPTNDQVRNLLGGGSIADISPVMRRWREKMQADALVGENIPEGIQRAAERFVQQLWIITCKETAVTLEKQLDEMKHSIADLTSEREEALEEVRALEEKLLVAEKNSRNLQNETENIKTKLASVTEKLQVTLIEKERFATIAEESLGNNEELNGQLRQSQIDIKELQTELISIAKSS